MPDGDSAPSVVHDVAERLRMARAAPIEQPTVLELKMASNRAVLERVCKYPLRNYAVLTPAQLAHARAGLGAGRPYPKEPGDPIDRRPLKPDELRQARADARLLVATGWEHDC